MSCAFCEGTKDESRVLFETGAWYATLNDKQAYLGRAVVILKRHAESLSALSPEEWDDLQAVIKRMESGYKSAFDPALFNWTCLMNHGFLTDPPAPHVHFHFRPRYKDPVRFAGVEFVDEKFGHHYIDCDSHDNTSDAYKVSDDVLRQIAEKLKEHLAD